MKYFIHDTNAFQDEKITQLFIEFGYEGIGLFFTILEKIALQEKPVNTNVLKKQLFVGKKLEKCWKFLETIDLISSNNGETFNKQLLNFSETFTIKKETNRKRIAEWREKQTDKENVTRTESVRNTLKVKVSKVKVSKEKEVKEKLPDFEGIDLSGLSSEFLKGWDILVRMKKWKNKSPEAIKSSLEQLIKYENLYAIELIKKAIAGEYQGVTFSDTDEKYKKWKLQKYNTDEKANGYHKEDRNAGTYRAAAELERRIDENTAQSKRNDSGEVSDRKGICDTNELFNLSNPI